MKEETTNIKGRNKTYDKIVNNTKKIGINKLVLVLIILFVGTFLLWLVKSNDSGASTINNTEIQSVDVSTGGSGAGSDQIYFGTIKTINSHYIKLTNVFYIPSTGNKTVQLQPQACQIDKPTNELLINRSSVNWWQNLDPSSQVSKAINSYQKEHPNGPDCSSN